MKIYALIAFAALTLLAPATLTAQTQLSSNDRLALLYAPKLNFTRGGDPLIRVGIVEGRKTVTFKPDMPIRVLPSGEDGPEIELPGNIEYTVSASEPQKGKYKHYVVVNRLPVANRGRVNALKDTWLKRGFIPEIIEVGGLFAVHGKVFDSRTVLIAVGGTNSRAKARKIKQQLESKYGIEGAIHSEVTRRPSALLTLSSNGIDVKVKARDVLQISPPRGRENTIAYTVPKIEKSYGKGFETRRYTGSLIFAPDNDGTVVAMVSLGAERLLKGVVPAETYKTAPAAALQAQAVAARNEIFSAIGVRNLAEPYMLRGDVMDQVYGGVGVEHPKTNKAVDDTRGQVMFYGKKIIEATYSSNAAGFTESNEYVWDMEPRPWLRGKLDTTANVPAKYKDGISEAELDGFLRSNFNTNSRSAPVSSAKNYRWEKTVPVSKPEAWLAQNNRSVGRIKDVKIAQRGFSGRVVRLEIVGTKGKTVVERELNARRLFGGLRSGLFLMKINRDANGLATSFEFRGGGFGHGVGMCQTGAIGMASQGKNYKTILKHYYSGIEVERLY